MAFKKRYSSKKKSTLGKRVSKIERIVKPESKFYNAYPALIGISGGNDIQGDDPKCISLFQSSGTNIPVSGTTANQRIGNKIMVKSVHLKLQVYGPVASNFQSGTNPNYLRGVLTGGTFANGAGTLSAVLDPGQCRWTMRIIVVKVKGIQPTLSAFCGVASASAFLDVIAGNSYPTYHRNLANYNDKMIKVLYDKTISNSIVSPNAGNFAIDIKLNFPKGHQVIFDDTNNTIDDGNLICLMYADPVNVLNAPVVYPNLQVRYVDM